MLRFVVGLLAVAAVGVIEAQNAPVKTAADLARLGPQVGEPAHDFRLPDQHGTLRDLKSILGPNGAMLVFFRSAEW